MTTPIRSAPQAAVVPPPIVPPTAGLTSLARDLSAETVRWLGGYSYRTEFPSAAYVRSQNTATIGIDATTNVGPSYVEIIPVALAVEDEVSTFSYGFDDPETRVRRILEAYTSKLLERELWIGEIAAADGLPNRYLANTDSVDVTPAAVATSPQNAAALLVDAMATAGAGDVMLHVPKNVAVRLPDAWQNEQLRQDHGFVVVAGAGYTGAGPDGTGTEWAYATDTVNFRLGPIDVVPGELRESINRTENTIMYYAQRFAAVDFAGPVFACQVATEA